MKEFTLPPSRRSSPISVMPWMFCYTGGHLEVCRHYVEISIGTVTALNSIIGYERATELAAGQSRP